MDSLRGVTVTKAECNSFLVLYHSYLSQFRSSFPTFVCTYIHLTGKSERFMEKCNNYTNTYSYTYLERIVLLRKTSSFEIKDIRFAGNAYFIDFLIVAPHMKFFRIQMVHNVYTWLRVYFQQ